MADPDVLRMVTQRRPTPAAGDVLYDITDGSEYQRLATPNLDNSLSITFTMNTGTFTIEFLLIKILASR